MTPRRRPGALGAGATVAATVLLLVGCKEVETASADGYQPAKAESVAGSDVMRVTFTKVGADRVSLETGVAGTSGENTVVPYASLIYDGQGAPWVFTNPRALTFERVSVVVDRVDGDHVLLSGGLSSGTRVVTVGAAEVYGAELNIAGGH